MHELAYNLRGLKTEILELKTKITKVVDNAGLTLFQRCFNAVSTLFQRCFNAVSTLFQRCFNSVSTLFQRCFNAISTLFQRCFNAVSMLIDGYRGREDSLGGAVPSTTRSIRARRGLSQGIGVNRG